MAGLRARAETDGFALVQVEMSPARPTDVLGMLRTCMRTTDIVKSDGMGTFQVILLDTDGANAALAVTRMTELFARNGLDARIGVSRYPDDGVAPEQLLAHAFEQISRAPDAPPTAMAPAIGHQL